MMDLRKDLQALISASMNDERESGSSRKASPPSTIDDKAEPIELARYTLDREHSFAQTGSDSKAIRAANRPTARNVSSIANEK